MSQVNLIIAQKSTTNKKISTTITNLRENQTNHAEQLAQALVALTTNEYQGATIEKISNVTESGKQTPTLTLGEWNTATNSVFCTVNYDGDGELYVNCTKPAFIYTVSGQERLEVITSTGISSFTGTIYAQETDNYYEISVNFSRT